jgi:hypothetical protein
MVFVDRGGGDCFGNWICNPDLCGRQGEEERMIKIIESEIMPFIEQNLLPIMVVCMIVGMLLYHWSERKYRERERMRRMFGEVNSSRYDEENIQ